MDPGPRLEPVASVRHDLKVPTHTRTEHRNESGSEAMLATAILSWSEGGAVVGTITSPLELQVCSTRTSPCRPQIARPAFQTHWCPCAALGGFRSPIPWQFWQNAPTGENVVCEQGLPAKGNIWDTEASATIRLTTQVCLGTCPDRFSACAT